MKKKILLIISIFGLMHSAFSQSKYSVNGYIIKENNDTAQGQIKLLNEGNYLRKIEFVSPLKAKQIYRADKIKGFYINDRCFESLIWQDAHYFFERIVKGEVSLYANTYTTVILIPAPVVISGGTVKSDEYFIVDDSTMISLKGAFFRRFMTDYVKKCPMLVDKIKNEELGFENSKQIIEEYNSCKGELTTAPKPFDAKTLKEFQETTSDSVFLSKNSDYSFHIETLDFIYGNDTTGNKFYTDLFLGEIGNVYGPYDSDTSVFYVKVLNADTSFKARVGNIWIDIKKGREIALEQATRILDEVKAGKDYNLYCAMYSDDKNKKTDCDLGWVYNKIMLEPFAAEIANHKKGDIYLVETTFGFHIVKSLADPYKERQVVKYVTLARKR
jgi:hypothetical protein